MVSDPHGYTPGQYLEAGFRAEQSGDRERAAQYYHYVAEAFPESPEGEAARGGLMRIGTMARPPESGDSPAGGAAAQPANQYAQQSPGGNWAQQAEAARALPAATAQRNPNHQRIGQHGAPQQIGQAQRAAGASSPGGAPGQAAGQRIVLGDLARLKLAPTANQVQPVERSAAIETAHDEGGQGEAMRLPEVVARRAREMAEADAYAPRPKYRGGRLMARMFVWIGWLVVAGGLASIVVGFLAMPTALAQTGAGFAVVLVAGGMTIVTGLFLVLVGQLALAVFDGSNALREITAFMRARQDL